MIENIERMLIGIQYPNIHRVRDRMGEIADAIGHLQTSQKLSQLRFRLGEYSSGRLAMQFPSEDDGETVLQIDPANIIGTLHFNPPKDSADPGIAEAFAEDMSEIVHRVYNTLAVNTVLRIGIVFEWTTTIQEQGKSAQSLINDQFIRYDVAAENIDMAQITIAFTRSLEPGAKEEGYRRVIATVGHPYEMDDPSFTGTLDFQRYLEPSYQFKKKDHFEMLLKSEVAHAVQELGKEAQRVLGEIAQK